MTAPAPSPRQVELDRRRTYVAEREAVQWAEFRRELHEKYRTMLREGWF